MYEHFDDGETVRAPIARGRVAEMLARGWIVTGIGDEDRVWMEGPELDGGPRPLAAALPAFPARPVPAAAMRARAA
jgi:hypothetical protein